MSALKRLQRSYELETLFHLKEKGALRQILFMIRKEEEQIQEKYDIERSWKMNEYVWWTNRLSWIQIIDPLPSMQLQREI